MAIRPPHFASLPPVVSGQLVSLSSRTRTAIHAKACASSSSPGRPRLAGADATHAWVSLWCGKARGWIGFDPTNAVLAQNDHIVLATGRDYSDVAPIDGIILAPGGQTLKVEVDVVPEGEQDAGLFRSQITRDRSAPSVARRRRASCRKIVNPHGTSPLLLIGDDAGNLVPSTLGTLGVAAYDLARHIGWDIGVEALGRALAARLDAIFVRQRYSRLVIDCNRDPTSAAAMPTESDGTAVPGNVDLDPAARGRCVAEIHEPYQLAVASALAGLGGSGVLVSLHSFTPVLAGCARPWDIGVLHDGHSDAFARRLLDWLTRHAGLTIGDNDPYRMDAIDHTVPRHAFDSGRPYVELEIRQDLLKGSADVKMMAGLLAAALEAKRP